MILLIGSTGDRVLRYFGSYLHYTGTPFCFLNQAYLGTRWAFEYSSSGSKTDAAFIVGNEWLGLDQISAIYTRIATVPESGLEEEKLHNRTLSLYSLLDVIPCLVVNRPRSMGSNGSKPFQTVSTHLVDGQSIHTPKTLIINQRQTFSSMCNPLQDQIIFKSISAVRSRVILLKDKNILEFDTIESTPVQFQECIRGFNLRVHVIGEEVYPVKIDSEGVDYRYCKREMSKATIDQSLSFFCIELAKHYGLHFAGVDILMQDSSAFVLEVNPSPGFTLYEEETGTPIAEGLRKFLLRGDTYGGKVSDIGAAH